MLYRRLSNIFARTIVSFQVMGLGTSTSSSAANPWWTGAPTKLVNKSILVPGKAVTEALEPGSTLHLPVYTLTFEIPDDDSSIFTGKAKRHDTLRIDLGDIVKMVIPGYKPKSYSVSALRKDQNEFDITIKIYPNGRASGYLDRLVIGDTIRSFGLQKGKVRQTPGSCQTPFVVGLIAYGVGITEAWPIAKAELEEHGEADKVVLLWASRTKMDTFWNDEMKDYQNRHPDKFQLVHIFSRENVPGCLHGRIDSGVLANVFKRDGDNKNEGLRFLSVGTKRMMKLTDEMLEEIGFPMPRHALLASKPS